MKNKIIVSVVLFVLTAILLTTAASAHSFSDVSAGAWYESYVSHVYEAGIMEGKADGVFDPEGTVTRAEFVTVMARIAGEGDDSYREYVSRFSDADSTAWYAPYMGWGVKTGLVKGQGDGKLAPTSLVSRAELATFTARLMEYLCIVLPDDPQAEKDFSDVDSGAYYASPVDTLRKCGLLNGDGTGKFNPGGTSGRHSVAALVSRLLTKCDAASTLATIHIVTETGGDVESKEDYIRAEFTLKGEDGRDISVGSMRIRGRGNSTWMMEKKSYRLKFDDDVCLMSSDMGDTLNKDWTLLANHCDKSLIRNHVAMTMGRELDGIDWSPYTELVDVYLNGEYRGVYMLSEQVEVGDQRVDIEDGEADDIGFLLELDNYAEGEYLVDYVTILGQKYSIKSDIKDKNQTIALKLYMETLMSVIKEGNREKIEKSVDIASAVDMYLLHELMRNVDTGYSSFYMYFDSPHGKMTFTAPWDFDLSTGNTTASPSEIGLHVAHCMDENGDYLKTVNTWFAALMSNEWFRVLVQERYNEVKETLLDTVDECCDFAYDNMAALDRNFAKWKVLSVKINQEPDNVLKLKNCTAQVDFLKAWIYKRAEWLDEYYNSEEFIKNYNLTPDSEKEYGRTDIVYADVWTIPDWYGGYTEAQIVVDTMTLHGIVQLELGRASTMTPESITRRLFVDIMGLEAGRFVIEFNMEDYNRLYGYYQGVGFDDAAHTPIRFTVKDTKTGERSEPAEYVFHVTKRDLTVLWPD
ncbi:MAG: CotH kinase family protein [Clostridia bacterium]|nr:CotH kinase family protein [Clostridia bacterium]